MSYKPPVACREASKAAHVNIRLARDALREGWLDAAEGYLSAAESLMHFCGGLETPQMPNKEAEWSDTVRHDVFRALQEVEDERDMLKEALEDLEDCECECRCYRKTLMDQIKKAVGAK